MPPSVSAPVRLCPLVTDHRTGTGDGTSGQAVTQRRPPLDFLASVHEDQGCRHAADVPGPVPERLPGGAAVDADLAAPDLAHLALFVVTTFSGRDRLLIEHY